jgi:hypothetical protein
MENTFNPFDAIDSRLKFIEETLVAIAAKEQPEPEKKYYSIAEAAKKLNMAEITLYRNGQTGKMPTKKIGSRLGVNKTFKSKFELNLNISFKLVLSIVKNSVRQNSKKTDWNFWDKIKKWVLLLKWLIQIIVA